MCHPNVNVQLQVNQLDPSYDRVDGDGRAQPCAITRRAATTMNNVVEHVERCACQPDQSLQGIQTQTKGGAVPMNGGAELWTPESTRHVRSDNQVNPFGTRQPRGCHTSATRRGVQQLTCTHVRLPRRSIWHPSPTRWTHARHATVCPNNCSVHTYDYQ